MTYEQMIIEQAIKLLNKLKSMINDSQNNDYIAAINIAIKALEKQIPKIPIENIKTMPIQDENGAYVDAGTILYINCPICGETVDLTVVTSSDKVGE